MRRAMILGALTPAAVVALTACPAPQTSSVGPWAACTADVTYFWEGEPVPCLPVAPQRIDVFVEWSGSEYDANVRCNNYGGTPTNEAPVYDGWTHCRTVDPLRYDNLIGG